MRKYVGPAKDSHNFGAELGGWNSEAEQTGTTYTSNTSSPCALERGDAVVVVVVDTFKNTSLQRTQTHKFNGDTGRT